MDFRLPGMDGVETTIALTRELPERRGRLPDRLREPARARRADGGGRRRLPAQGPGARRDRRRDPLRGRVAPMNLTAENTAIVLDSTADFPDAQIRFPNMRVVPLYVRFGEESFRDYVELDPHGFYERLRTAAELPTTSQPTPQDFLSTYDALSGYERIYSLHISSKLSGTFQSASLAAVRGRRRPGPPDRHRVGVGRHRDARARDPGAARARDDRRGDRGARRAPPRRAPASSSPSTRSSSSPRAAGSGAPGRSPGNLLNVKPILTIEDGEVVPVTRVRGRAEGARGVPHAASRRRRRTGPASASGSRTPRRRSGRAAAGDRAREPRPQAEVELVTTSAPSSARTPARARSASSGSRACSWHGRTGCDTRPMSRPQPGFAAVDPPDALAAHARPLPPGAARGAARDAARRRADAEEAARQARARARRRPARAPAAPLRAARRRRSGSPTSSGTRRC